MQLYRIIKEIGMQIELHRISSGMCRIYDTIVSKLALRAIMKNCYRRTAPRATLLHRNSSGMCRIYDTICLLIQASICKITAVSMEDAAHET